MKLTCAYCDDEKWIGDFYESQASRTYPKCKTCCRDYYKQQRLEHPERTKAHNAVMIALRNGTLVRGPCAQASCYCSGKIVGHHEDYSRPLDVTWLCGRHHWRRHHPPSWTKLPDGVDFQI